MIKQRKVRNTIGPQVRRFRCAKKWSQEKLLSKLRDSGWNICRQRIARIESGEARVSEYEVVLVASALQVQYIDLLPKLDSSEPLYLALSKRLEGQVKTLASPEEILASRSRRALPPEVKER